MKITRDDIIAILAAVTLAIALPVAGAAAALFLMPIERALAHKAPSGWNYAMDCCSNQDCSELPSEAVQITDNGFVVTVTPDMNKQIKATRTYTIAYTATGLRESPDGKYHICLRPEYANNAGEIFGGGVICFYIPPQGY
jgi:hypothetical protein